MPQCLACQHDYPETADRCPACGAAVPGKDEEWQEVAAVSRPELAAIVEGLLDGAGIPSEILDRSFSELPVPTSTSVSTLKVLVPASRVEEATALLSQPFEGVMRCPKCGHLGSAEDAVCEYCPSPSP